MDDVPTVAQITLDDPPSGDLLLEAAVVAFLIEELLRPPEPAAQPVREGAS